MPSMIQGYRSKRISHYLLVTAILEIAAAKINDITIYSACNFFKYAL